MERQEIKNRDYVYQFQKLGFGLFVHFGPYSAYKKGEWSKKVFKIFQEEYNTYIQKFNPSKTWARNLVRAAKNAGCKYITLTSRHHDGFSLFDTKGLNDYDTVHTIGRDLVAEFVTECRKQGVVPMLYHTLLDWYNKDYNENFPKYIDYLVKSVEIICSNYGELGGIWFDGMWDKKQENWQEDRLYGMIRRYQPTTMIINNTGLSQLGKIGHPEIDSVTFERGKPCATVDSTGRPRAGEMCQVFNDHWGYAEQDINYKSVNEIIENLVDCRKYNCNFLLNIGPMANGKLRTIDAGMLEEIGKWVKINKKILYGIKGSDIQAENADIVTDGKKYYAIIKNVGMDADHNVACPNENLPYVTVHAKVKKAHWLDNGQKILVEDNKFLAEPFGYGVSMCVRIAALELVREE